MLYIYFLYFRSRFSLLFRAIDQFLLKKYLAQPLKSIAFMSFSVKQIHVLYIYTHILRIQIYWRKSTRIKTDRCARYFSNASRRSLNFPPDHEITDGTMFSMRAQLMPIKSVMHTYRQKGVSPKVSHAINECQDCLTFISSSTPTVNTLNMYHITRGIKYFDCEGGSNSVFYVE